MVNKSIKSFYVTKYPTDDLGSSISNRATFLGLFKRLKMGNNVNIYKYIFDCPYTHDSLVRERLFGELSRMLGVDYNVIYNMWLTKN